VPVNRLAHATSPYLLQHRHNPVDWYPWGEEALERARAEQRPIFLSIGYAACHWCHVMERESFENEAVAEVLNREFVAVKVDREERPDLDEIYMAATQILTHSGGWPMSVFLTPDLKPFYAGTYFPPEDRWGRPGFRTLLLELARLWRESRDRVEEQAERLAGAVASMTAGGEGRGPVSHKLVENAVRSLARQYDPTDGGFGAAPKFPPSMRLELLLRRRTAPDGERGLEMATHTLDRMARGGMYDQVGGGFHRYSVDERWLVPHFEKMLYDNALLARTYALAFEATGRWYYERITREVLDYVRREMTHPDGGFYSTTDADSEGEEGRFFVWSPAEVQAVLGEADGALFCAVYDVTTGGNFEGRSIPNLIAADLDAHAERLGVTGPELDARLAPLRRRLWEHREQRVHPLLDDKVLTAWNGLMIRAFAEGFRVLGDPAYREAAERAAAFVLERLRVGGRLLRSWRAGEARLNAYQEDYAALALGLLDLHSVTGTERWRDEALGLLEAMEDHFWDESAGSYYFTSHDHEALITRPRSLQDGATPSGNSLAALAAIRAARITGGERHRQRAARVLSGLAPQIAEFPAAFPNALVAVDEYLALWPEGIRVPGAETVEMEGLLSRTAVAPGGRIRVGVRLTIREGFHIHSSEPLQDYLIPTRLTLSPGPFTLAATRYPAGEPATLAGETLSVYSGVVLLEAELEAPPTLPPGSHTAEFVLRLQTCDHAQCYPPLEARLRFEVPVTSQGGAPQHADVFPPSGD
jgi:uncharacterized protein YyaL (SSP411 family)